MESKDIWCWKWAFACAVVVGFIFAFVLMVELKERDNQLQSCLEHTWNELDFFSWGFCSGYINGERICYHQFDGDWIKCNQGNCEVIE